MEACQTDGMCRVCGNPTATEDDPDDELKSLLADHAENCEVAVALEALEPRSNGGALLPRRDPDDKRGKEACFVLGTDKDDRLRILRVPADEELERNHGDVCAFAEEHGFESWTSRPREELQDFLLQAMRLTGMPPGHAVEWHHDTPDGAFLLRYWMAETGDLVCDAYRRAGRGTPDPDGDHVDTAQLDAHMVVDLLLDRLLLEAEDRPAGPSGLDAGRGACA